MSRGAVSSISSVEHEHEWTSFAASYKHLCLIGASDDFSSLNESLQLFSQLTAPSHRCIKPPICTITPILPFPIIVRNARDTLRILQYHRN
jgi:hypothetical protein